MELMEMNKSFQGRDFLSLYDYTPEEIHYLIDLAIDLKYKQKKGIPHPYLAGKTLGMIFQKSSTRTRVSFEVGMYQLGGMALFLSSNDLQIGRGEPVKDTARVLSRYLDGIMIRTFSHDEVLELAQYADIPVINGLTDLLHPCQVLADLMTIKEHKGQLAGLKLAYVGDGNNMAHSLMYGGAKMGMDVVIASPAGYVPDETVTRQSTAVATETGGSISITGNIEEAVKDADVIYTDVWASMGQEEEAAERKKAFAAYQVNNELLKMAKSDVIVLHCLPAHRGEEITDEVIEGPHSVVFDEAENRLHAQKAIMALLMA
ncbi:MAG: ornithine carbamoyltransferase [Clostridia bacterium]|nr:ornithine carbamoyltransferase [Clostridia bacterium]